MHDFRGRVILLDGSDDYIYEDEEEFVSDSEVEGILEELEGEEDGEVAENFVRALILPFLPDQEEEEEDSEGPNPGENNNPPEEAFFSPAATASLGAEDTSTSSSSPSAGSNSNSDSFLSSVGSEEVGLEGYFAFGPERRRRSSGLSFSRSQISEPERPSSRVQEEEAMEREPEEEEEAQEQGQGELISAPPAAEEDPTCNPMVSSDSEEGEDSEALRGDRIGSTTYCERHVLKILLKWVQVLPTYSAPPGEGEEEERRLEVELEEEIALLWDMSFEPDVMAFLVEHNVFNIIKETCIRVVSCSRLQEIALGILANILSQPSIAEDFSVHDASLALVEAVVGLLRLEGMPRVPVLIQLFAVLRRITWFLGGVALIPKWKDLLLSPDFLMCSNFVLSSSRNALLLGNVILVLHSLLEALSPEHQNKEAEPEEGDESGEESESYFGKALKSPPKDWEDYAPLCKNNLLPALTEGLKELLTKDGSSSSLARGRRASQKFTSSRRGEEDSEAPEDAFSVPEGHVQTALLSGLSALYYLYKTRNGKRALKEGASLLLPLLTSYLDKFHLICDLASGEGASSTLDYFALTANLLSLSLRAGEGGASGGGVAVAVAALVKTAERLSGDLKEETVQSYSGVSRGSKTFLALVTHEFLASLGDSFGSEAVARLRGSEELKGLQGFLSGVDQLVEQVARAAGNGNNGSGGRTDLEQEKKSTEDSSTPT